MGFLDSRNGSAAAIFLCLSICFVGVWRPLWTPDEPREAEISHEMLLSPGIVPTLNGRTFIEKPPLYYWSVASVFSLTGNVSPTMARSVSALASFLTLLIVFLWGRRECSAAVGIVGALGMATSERFLVSSHWVLSDPLLMLFTTAALWAGWELLRRGTVMAAAGFYGALVLALWTKGLVGPVMIGAGLAVYCAVRFREAPWRRLRVFTGAAIMIAATGVLAAAIYASDGAAAVREWFWVNHVLRFVHPEGTGHEGPIYYYLLAVPVALFPWWSPVLDSLRPSVWRTGSASQAVRRYWGLMPLGMIVFLSLSVTKRELYLLPALPAIFLFVGAHTVDAWSVVAANLRRSIRWWLQVGLSTVFTIGLVAAAAVYTREAGAAVIAYLLVAAAAAAAAVYFGIRRRAVPALVSLASLGVAGAVGLMGVVPAQLDSSKNMVPFLQSVDAALPRDRIVYAVGHVDETLEGIVPFTICRRLIPLTSDEVASLRPRYVLVQDTDGGNNLPELPASFAPLLVTTFGTERYMGLWQDTSERRQDAGAATDAGLFGSESDAAPRPGTCANPESEGGA